MDERCIACLLRSMEGAQYIHEVLQRNGHQDKGQKALEWLQWTGQDKKN